MATPQLPPLRGRDRELASMRDQLFDATHGRSSALLIEGGAGTGKTRLVEEAVQLAQSYDMRVLHTALHPRDAQGSTECLHATLHGASPEVPTLWCVDDAHWADPHTIAALDSQVGRVSGAPIALLLTGRPGEHVAPIAHLA